MDKKHYDELFDRLLNGRLSPEEMEELLGWLSQEADNSEVSATIMKNLVQGLGETDISPEVREALAARLPLILQAEKQRSGSRVRLMKQPWFRYAAAVVIFGMLGLSVYYLSRAPLRASNSNKQNVATVADIAPGHEGAILTLADGRQILLDSLGNGSIPAAAGAELKLIDGQLVYGNGAASSSGSSYNTVTTPKGRQFQVVLPDQTKVWLNAASSLRYPTAFTGKERMVEVTGEAYFEVAKNRNMPFIVRINEETAVKVLGTHFNINAYTNEEEIRTTLLEGSVQVSSHRQEAMIKPGQQARVTRRADSGMSILESVDLEKVIAWKNGVFDFQDASLEEVMHQLERWYDIEVAYEKGVPKIEFVGKMGKDLTLKGVLRGLELSKVHFKLEGRTLTVLP